MLRSRLTEYLTHATTRREVQERVDQAVVHVNSAGFDEWGLDPRTLKASIGIVEWIYRSYFRVDALNIDRVPPGKVLLVANHGGQIPLDGMLISASLLLDATPPRIARGMVERWFPSLPYISTFFTRCGGMVGDSRNCRLLLERDNCVLVFPEGVKGSGKTIHELYQLQRFGTGFMRLALETKAPIVPVTVIGCEETYPSLHNFKSLAKLLGIPYVPITPFFPWLGPIGMLPLPTKVTLRFGQPMRFEENPDAPDSRIQELVQKVRGVIEGELQEGLRERGDRIFG